MAKKQAFVRILAAAIALLLTGANTCTPPPLARTWVNAGAKLHDISKIKLVYNCGEKPIKAYDPLSAALWIVKAHTRCARTDCTWGRAKILRERDGTMRAVFNTFAAKRILLIRQEGGLLDVSVKIIYHDPRRQPEVKSYYLHPEQE